MAADKIDADPRHRGLDGVPTVRPRPARVADARAFDDALRVAAQGERDDDERRRARLHAPSAGIGVGPTVLRAWRDAEQHVTQSIDGRPTLSAAPVVPQATPRERLSTTQLGDALRQIVISPPEQWLPKTKLLLEQIGDTWSVRVSTASRDVSRIVMHTADEVAQRFAQLGLGRLAVDTVDHLTGALGAQARAWRGRRGGSRRGPR